MPATDDYLRDPKFMHKVFCVSAVALFLATVWMMWADYADEWRTYQRQALAFIAAKDRARIAQIEAAPEHQAELAAAKEQIKLARQELEKRHADVAAVEADVTQLAQQNAATMRELRLARAVRDVDRASYGLTIRDSAPADEQAGALEKFRQAEEAAQQLEIRNAEEALALHTARTKLTDLTGARDQAEKELKSLNSNIDRLTAAINRIEPSHWFPAFKRNLMLMPVINGFNSPERIQQDWLPQLKIDLGGMSKVDRFDRCRTCHYTIDRVETGTEPAFPFDPHGNGENGKYPQPFASHPRLDLFLTSTSPHPISQFGCTVCHEGQGSGTSFQNASHTPNDPHQLQEWQQKYGWFDNHFWQLGMLPERFRESTCIKCHVNVTELGNNQQFGATAPKVVEGYNLVKEYGCFGCHEIHGFDAGKVIGPDLRLEPVTAEAAQQIADDPTQVAGTMRKVGPSLRHLASKVDDRWVAYWTEEPKRFRPTTRMPQFFHLSNQHDALAEKFNPLELAGMSQYLLTKSQPLDLLTPAEGYQPDAARGKALFGTKGCVACHTHQDVPAINADFGPDLSRIQAKLRSGAAGFNWLYTWIREPERHHPRTKMPHLFLTPEGTGATQVDPAADIAAFLLNLSGSPADFKTAETWPAIEFNDQHLDDLVQNFLGKLLTQSQIADLLKTGHYPYPAGRIKGDEIELASDSTGDLNRDEWRSRKLNYVGRKTITRYGCYGCHDIPGFEVARPIGTALQDWGKKDTSRLAFEHIHEYLQHHGQPALGVPYETFTKDDAQRLKLESTTGVRIIGGRGPGGPTIRTELMADQHTDGKTSGFTLQRDDVIVGYDNIAVADAAGLDALLQSSVAGSRVTLNLWRDGEELTVAAWPDGSLAQRVHAGMEAAVRDELSGAAGARELSAGFYYDSLNHHGRPGFLWQKLRQPRSYDYKLTETKPYDDRLRMPKFPFNEDQIDAIATFILGLRAEPPAENYLYQPQGRAGAILRGEQLIEKFNCASCHMLDLPTIRYGVNVDDLFASDPTSEFPEAVKLLEQLKPARNGLTGETVVVKTEEGLQTLPVLSFHGQVTAYPYPDDDPLDQEYVAELWETLQVDDIVMYPTTKLIFPALALQGITPATGGQFAEWLAQKLTADGQVKQLPLGYQAAPPPLYREGIKVQTPWLYKFLRNPTQIRHTTVLRMPRFNMSPAEAQDLANYFAAVDGAGYPYQTLPQTEAPYLNAANSRFHAEFPDKSDDYLAEAWKVLNSPLCVKCHAVGGRVPVSTDPANDIRAPNLDLAGERLRPDWLLLWLYKPPWITPYTSMPQNFPPGKKNLAGLFGGEGDLQTKAVRDALMNYRHLMERDGRIVYDPDNPAPNPPADTTSGTGGR